VPTVTPRIAGSEALRSVLDNLPREGGAPEVGDNRRAEIDAAAAAPAQCEASTPASLSCER
jgi:hypothetical protein